jgi:Neuraminidase (sialidase)
MKRGIVFLVAVALAVTPFAPATAAPKSWQSAVQMTDDPWLSLWPDIAVDDGVVHAVWHSIRKDHSSDRVMYRRSADGGQTWDTPVRLRGGVGVYRPSVAVVGDMVHVAWVEDGAAVIYRSSHDGGTTWGSRKRLSSRLPGSRDVVDVAAWGETVHVAFGDSSRGGFRIFHRTSHDGGQTWSKRTGLSRLNDGGSSHSASVAVRRRSVHVVWWQDPGSVRHRSSDDGGATWSKISTLDTLTPSFNEPSVAVAKSAVVVAWLDRGDGLPETRIAYRRSLDGGETWTGEESLTDLVAAESPPDVAASRDRVHVVWSEKIGNEVDVLYRRSFDAGATWRPLRHTSENLGSSEFPAVAEDERSVHVVWSDDVTGNREIFSRSFI